MAGFLLPNEMKCMVCCLRSDYKMWFSVNTYLHTNHIKFNLVFFLGQRTNYTKHTVV